MPMTDPLGDMLTRIRNGQQARKDSVLSPASKLRARVLDVLQREGYIRGYREEALSFLGWMLLATYCTARSSWIAWVLAGAAAASFVLNFALSWFGRTLSSTAAGTILGGVIAVLLWLCVPAWLVVVGLRK